MQIKAFSSCNSAQRCTEVSLACNETPLLLYELIDYLIGGRVKNPATFSILFDRQRLAPVEQELYNKWSKRRSKVGVNFLSLINPIYSFCFKINFCDMDQFLINLNAILLADIFDKDDFWLQLKPSLLELRDAFGDWCFSDPIDHFSRPIEELPYVLNFVSQYEVPDVGFVCCPADDDDVYDDLGTLLEYNQDMEYALHNGVYPCAICFAHAS